MTGMKTSLAALLALAAFGVTQAGAQIAVSSNDGRMMLDNGTTKVLADAKPDTATIIDLGVNPPKILAEIEVPGSVAGPPLSVAIMPDESLAFISASMKHDPADRTKQVPNNIVSIVDLKANPPAVVGKLEAGLGPAGMSITRDGKVLLVANRSEGSISVFRIEGKGASPVGKVTVSKPETLLSHVAITPDGKTVLATVYGEHYVAVLKLDGDKLELTPRQISTGVRPYPLAIAPDGRTAFVANIGRGTGDVDTVSVIDLTLDPPRTVAWVDLGYETPEGLVLSPDGKLCAVVLQHGTGRPSNSPFFNKQGRVVLFRVEGVKLTKVGEAPIGRWSQGAAFSRDGKTILVQNMVEKNLMVFRFENDKLTDTGVTIPLGGGGAAIRTADK